MDVHIREVNPDDADALAHVLVCANRAAYAGIVPPQCLTFTEAESAANWRRTLGAGLPQGDFIFIVEDERTKLVIAYAWGGPSADDSVYRGVLRQISVLPSHQRRGIGRLLVRRVAQRLAAEQGIRSMRVEVLRCNPNRAFYERLGARYVSERPHDWDGVVMPMCLYGWTDTHGLCGDGPVVRARPT